MPSSFDIQTGQQFNTPATPSSFSIQTGQNIPPPNTTNAVPSSQLSGSALNLPPTPTPDNGSTLVAGAVGGMTTPGASQTPATDLAVSGDYNQDPGYKSAQDALTTSTSNLATDQASMPSESGLLKSAQDSTGATADLTTLNNLKTDLAAATAQFDIASQDKETQGIQSGTPAVFYQGEQAAIQRQKAVVVGAKAAQVQAAQGNYDAAEKLAEQTATLQFSDWQNKINNIKDFISLNQDNLSRAEKLAASKMQSQAVFLQDRLDQQKTLRTLALTKGVTKPFMNVGGTVVRTSDGYKFATPEEAAAAGVDVNNWSNVQTVDSSTTSQKFTQIGTDDFGNPVYGFANEATGTVTPLAPTTGNYTANGNSLVSTTPDTSKVINGYDFTSYATDPNWGNAVNSILQKVPEFSLPNDAQGPTSPQQQAQTLQAYIQKVAPNSKITGQMVIDAAKQYGVDPRVMTAIMQQESQFGTKGTGAKTFNPGNVGNVDSGATSNKGDWQSGVNALAANMAQRTTQSSTTSNAQNTFNQYGLLGKTNFNPNDTIDQLAQKYLDQYIKNGSVPSASSLGRNLKPQVMGQLDTRARDLYYQATGTAMPSPQIIKGYQDLITANNKLANNLKIQEQTVKANVDLSLANMKANSLNSSNFKPLNNLLNSIDDLFNDPATGQLIAQNSTIQNELGSLLAVKNASGTTVFDKMSSAGIISKNDNEAQIKAKVGALLQEAANFSTSIQGANADAYKITDPFIQDPNNPIITMSKAKGFDYVGALSSGASYDDIINFLQTH